MVAGLNGGNWVFENLGFSNHVENKVKCGYFLYPVDVFQVKKKMFSHGKNRWLPFYVLALLREAHRSGVYAWTKKYGFFDIIIKGTWEKIYGKLSF